MNKSELIKEVALKGQLSFNEATNAVDAIMETIAETMHKGENGTGHNPATGGSMLIPANRQVKFRPGSKMKLE